MYKRFLWLLEQFVELTHKISLYAVWYFF